MGLLKRYEFILIVSFLDLISSVNREPQTHEIWLVETIETIQRDHSLIQLDCTLWPHMLWLYLHCHTFCNVDQLEESSSGLFRLGLIGHFTINWVMVKTLHLVIILSKI